MPNQQERHPKAYFDAAMGYQSAADRLRQVIEAGEGLPIRDPVYFLYAHAVELALKACLMSCGFAPARAGREGHGISEFFDQCREQRLISINDPHREMHNLVAFSANGNERHQYRYPDKPVTPRGIPDLGWTKEAVAQLMAEVEPHVDAWSAANPASPAPSTNRITFGKPMYRSQPVPTRKGP